MPVDMRQQIVISGVGGQGVLFITQLLAEAAIADGLAVFTSETHGMAQRGGSVVSHLKVGDFASPLIRAGRADGLLALKPESLSLHGHLLAAGGWCVANCCGADGCVDLPAGCLGLDAERIARAAGNPRAVNLVVLGFALAADGRGRLFCSRDALAAALARRLAARPQLLAASRRALEAGYREGMSG